MSGDAFEQMSLLGDSPAPKPAVNRLFFALMPDEADAARLHAQGADLRAQHGLRGKPLAENRLHITLHHLGDFPELPEMMVARAQRAGAAAEMPPIEVCFDEVKSFGREEGANNPFVMVGAEAALAGVVQLHRQLSVCMAKEGLSREIQRHITPHMTLAYDSRLVSASPITPPARWTARDLVLVHSLIGQSVYFVLGRWPLQAP